MSDLIVVSRVSLFGENAKVEIVPDHDGWQACREDDSKSNGLAMMMDVNGDMVFAMYYFDTVLLELVDRHYIEAIVADHMNNVVHMTGEIDGFEPTEKLLNILRGL